MKFKNEHEFTAHYCDLLRQCNCAIKVFAGGNIYQQPGLPDRYVAIPGLSDPSGAIE